MELYPVHFFGLYKRPTVFYRWVVYALGMLIDKAIEEYINWKGIYSPSGAMRYKPRLKHFSSTIAKNELHEITTEDVIRFHKTMELKNYSRATIAYSLTIIKNFFLFWKERGEQVPNPKEIKSISFVTRMKPVVSSEDFDKLSGALNEYKLDDLMIKLVLHLLWDTGMRVSELTDLNLSDLQEPSAEGIRTAQIVSKKSSRYNLVAWSSRTDRLLNLYLGVRLDHHINQDALFINTKRKRAMRITRRTVQRWVKIAAQKAGISKAITPHSFRHGKAHYMLNNGANIRDVQAVLRHVNPVTTFHYLSLNQKQFIDVAGKHLKQAA